MLYRQVREMQTKTAVKILTEEKGFSIEEILECQKSLGLEFLEFRTLICELAAIPEYRKLN